jgi:hypothetical protein
LWPHIVAMTPLAWGAGAAKAKEAMEIERESITLDFMLLAGRKKETLRGSAGNG